MDIKTLYKRLVKNSILIYQFFALIAFAVLAILANQWLQRPFIGAFIEQTLVVNTVSPTGSQPWGLRNQIDGFGYRISAINGVEINNTWDFQRQISSYSHGEIVSLMIKSPQNEITTSDIQLGVFPLSDQITFLFIPYLIGFIYLCIGLWVLNLRKKDTPGRIFAFFTASAAISSAALFDVYTTHILTYLWTFNMAMTGGSLIYLALVFPQESPFVNRFSFLGWISLPLAAGLALVLSPSIYNLQYPTAYASAWAVLYIFIAFSCSFFIGMVLLGAITAKSPLIREQSWFILRGSLVSFGPLVAWFFLKVIWNDITFTPYLLLPLIIFPAVLAYTLLRNRLVKTDLLINRGLLYAGLGIITVTGYALLVTGTTLVLGTVLPDHSPLITGLLIFGIALSVNPLRSWMQTQIDATFARGKGKYHDKLEAFSKELTQAMELPEVIDLIRRYIYQSLRPANQHIFIYDSISEHYISAGDETGRPTSDLRFPAASALVQILSARRVAIFLGEHVTLPSILQHEKARLALLGVQLFIPLPGRARLTGWLALGSRLSGEAYQEQDLNFLEAISDQSALAIERAQVVDNLERRMLEMNVLTRVSQGINVTLMFDDILELLYAQTNQVIPTLDFNITLYDNFSHYLYHVFCLVNDDRLSEKENLPLPIGQGLELEVLQNRRPLVVNDYERECRSRGLLPSINGIYAWMGTPLNAGAETIGLMSVGSRDPSVNYTQEQINLLMAIADQAAGAIVKGRLLHESERRTRQLTLLNEVARSLTSTLELDRLLNQILQSAVEILNCEAGSLLLTDEQTDELIFEVVVGPVAADLAGQRLPPGTGLVGKAVETRQPEIANDVRRTKEWFDKTDQDTGFVTQDLLVVPMLVKDNVIGVIEVINRRDGLPFTPDDQELLAAFTSQAAVAMENARLYTLTDQALAARVEELSVMQRIDRELNASLDVERAMRITLSWATRQSVAEAGLVGSVVENGIQIMASQGYRDELAPYGSLPLPFELTGIKEAIETGAPIFITFEDGNPGAGLLSSGHNLYATPISRETGVIGVLFLENVQAETNTGETLAFLTRLCDHAAIAIANAQLYAEVQQANQAKSDFVSFVSHELKTPMTSIKGFTDLLASGMVGAVNENQANFLSTIRSNVDRMSTLVSDLADASRIEAGRLRLDFAAVSVPQMVDEVIRSCRTQIDEKQQTLELQIPKDLPMVWCDRMRMIQVLINLVSNANKYSPQGGNIIICAEPTLNKWNPDGSLKEGLSEGDAAQVVHISIQDTGFGINPEDQKKIFQKFFRSDDQKIRDAPGTGLGLNITKTLVEMQGGIIWFVSEFRQGATFQFTIPVAETA
jgi:signal transduction histidine kinase/putative methionine-R-sulfoxide reductase with GAF domain